MSTKVVMVMNGTTGVDAHDVQQLANPHGYGFTESFWANTNDIATLHGSLVGNLFPKRAALLPKGASVVAARYYSDTGGRGVLFGLALRGGSYATDLVNCALLAFTRNPVAPVQRRWWIHNVPDNQFGLGEYSPTQAYAAAMANFLGALNPYFYQGISRTGDTAIVSITSGGLVTLGANSPFAVGTQVTVSRTLTGLGRRFGGLFAVASVGPLATQFTLTGWQAGACVGGRAFVKGKTLYQIGGGPGANTGRAGTRRVGRPFDLYRGRRSAHHSAI